MSCTSMTLTIWVSPLAKRWRGNHETAFQLIAGYEQSQIERAIEGSTWMGYFVAQAHRWFAQAMFWRQIGGWMFTLGFVLLVWDLLTIGKRETRPAEVLPAEVVTA